MAMGRRRKGRQKSLWIALSSIKAGPGHPFYERLNELLDRHGFDELVEEQCAQFCAETMGRPSLAPAVCFRMLLVGCFEGIDSERGIAWRVADSISLRPFSWLRAHRSYQGAPSLPTLVNRKTAETGNSTRASSFAVLSPPRGALP